MVYVGIDPGLDGAIACVESDGKLLWVNDMPIVKTGARRQLDDAVLAGTLISLAASTDRIFGVAMVAVEKVQGLPKQSAPAAFVFGTGYGIIQGCLAAAGVPRVLVRPQDWKKVMLQGTDKSKGAAVLAAKRLHPEAAEYLTLKKHHGRAEAILLADYARRYHGTQ